MIDSVRVGCRRFLEGSHGDRAHVSSDELDHRALHHYAGLNQTAVTALRAPGSPYRLTWVFVAPQRCQLTPLSILAITVGGKVPIAANDGHDRSTGFSVFRRSQISMPAGAIVGRPDRGRIQVFSAARVLADSEELSMIRQALSRARFLTDTTTLG